MPSISPSQGKALEKNSVQFGSARFTVLGQGLVRMEWSADLSFEDRASFFAFRRDLPAQDFKKKVQGRFLELETSRFRLRWEDDGKPFHADSLQVHLKTGDGQSVWTPGTKPVGNLGGTLRTLDECDRPWKLNDGLLSRDGWHWQDDSGTFVFGSQEPPVAVERESRGALDWYFFAYGSDYRAALSEFVSLSGRIPLPPRYAFGSWYSRYWPYTSHEFMEIAKEYTDRGFPLDVMVIDMDWHKDGWTGYSWNRELIPDPPKLLADLHAEGLRVTLNLHPHDGVQPHEDQYADFSKAMGSNGNGKTNGIPFDVADPKFMENYFKFLLHPLEEQGVDFWWMDWQQGETSKVQGLDPLAWLNELHFRDLQRGGGDAKRGMNFSRWAGWGDHRHPVQFSGDTFSCWEVLEYLLPFTSTAGNVGCAYWSHDLGGHFPGAGGKIDKEVFLRWLQFGALSPVMRVHASRAKGNDRRPWMFGDDFTEAARKAYQLRARLVPYFYTAARQCHDEGVAPLRPMYIDHAEQDKAYQTPGQYMLGQDLLCAPAASAGLGPDKVSLVRVWFPEGDWYHWETHQHFRGPLDTVIPVPLDSMPVFVRGGAPLCIYPQGVLKATEKGRPAHVRLYPGPETRREHYEDDGLTVAYLNGGSRRQVASKRDTHGALRIESSGDQGAFLDFSNLVLESAACYLGGTGSELKQVSAADSTAAVQVPWGSEQRALLDRAAMLLAYSRNAAGAMPKDLTPRAKALESALREFGENVQSMGKAEAALEALVLQRRELIQELASGSDQASSRALRLFCGVQLRTRTKTKRSGEGFVLEAELSRSALAREKSSPVVHLEYKAFGGERTDHELELFVQSARQTWKFDLDSPSRFLGMIEGNLLATLDVEGVTVTLIEPYRWDALALKEWTVLGECLSKSAPKPVGSEREFEALATLGYPSPDALDKKFEAVYFPQLELIPGERIPFDFEGLFRSTHGECHAVGVLDMEEPGDYDACFRWEGEAKLWVNGEEIKAEANLKLKLRRGSNLLWVRLAHVGRKAAGFALSLSPQAARKASNRPPHAVAPSATA